MDAANSFNLIGDKEIHDYIHEAVTTYPSVFDARNVAFKGSFCLEGDGIGIVVRTGKYTVISSLFYLFPPFLFLLQKCSI